MNKGSRAALLSAVCLLLMGGALFAGGMAMVKWDFTKLSTVEYETNEYELKEPVVSLSIESNTADVIFIPTQEEVCRVVCHEETKVKHRVDLHEGRLTVKAEDERRWQDHLGIRFKCPEVRIYLPKGEYGALFVKVDTGNVEVSADLLFERIELIEGTGKLTNCASAKGEIKIQSKTGSVVLQDVSAGVIELSSGTGKVCADKISCTGAFSVTATTSNLRLSEINCRSLQSKGGTGSIYLTDVIVTEQMQIECDTGDVRLEGSDAAEIFIKTDTGDVKGQLLSQKVFITKSETGTIRVPDSLTGGRCEITTNTGDIKITVEGRE